MFCISLLIFRSRFHFEKSISGTFWRYHFTRELCLMSVSVVKADVCRPNKTPRTKQTQKKYLGLSPTKRKKCFKAAFICQLQTSNSSSHRTKLVGSFLFSYLMLTLPSHPTPPQISAPSFSITDVHIYTQSYFQHHTTLSPTQNYLQLQRGRTTWIAYGNSDLANE